MPRFRATTTIVHECIIDWPSGAYTADAKLTAIEAAVEAIEADALDVIYEVELSALGPLTEEGEG